MRSTLRVLLLALSVILLVGVALVFFRAQRTLSVATRTAETSHRIAFSWQTLDPSPARTVHFEPVAPAPAFSDGVFFRGEFYLAGPGGLSRFSSAGVLQQTLRTGTELPPALPTALGVGRLRNASEPQILLATEGGGLLVLEATPGGRSTVHQLLPADPSFRELTALLPLPSGDLLLGTRHSGVLLFDGANLAPLFMLDPALEVTALASPDSTSFLVGTRTNGVFYVHGGTVVHAEAATGMPDNQVEAIASTPGRAYVGTPLGVAEFDLNAPAFHPARTLAPGLFSHTLVLSGDGLEVGTMDQGVRHILLNRNPHLTRASISIAPAGASAEMQRIDKLFAAESTLFALADGALVRQTSSGWTHPLAANAAQSLTDRNISALAFAPDGRLYVGFFDHGLDLLNPSAPDQPPVHLEDDRLFCINRLVLDPRLGTIAAATANGLVLFDGGGTPRQTLTRRDGLLSNHVTDVAFTQTGTVIATPAGLTFLGLHGTESLYAFQGLVNNHVYALSAETGSSRVLAGTLGGLSVTEGTQIRRSFTVSNSALGHNWITAVAPLPAGTSGGGWLVGTYGAGVERLTAKGTFEQVELPAGSARNLVVNPNALLVTSTHVYAGTLGHGMLSWSIATGRWSAITDGLPSLNVTAFAEKSGQLYIGTDNGLLRIAETSLP